MEIVKRIGFAVFIVLLCPAIALLAASPMLIGGLDFAVGADYEQTKIVVVKDRPKAAKELLKEFDLVYPDDLVCTAFEHGDIGLGYTFSLTFSSANIDLSQLAARIVGIQLQYVKAHDNFVVVDTGHGGRLIASREDSGVIVTWTND